MICCVAMLVVMHVVVHVVMQDSAACRILHKCAQACCCKLKPALFNVGLWYMWFVLDLARMFLCLYKDHAHFYFGLLCRVYYPVSY